MNSSPITLHCPEHQAPLQYDAQRRTHVCTARACEFPVVNAIPRFVPLENYASAFGLQWKKFSKTQLDSYTGTTLSKDRLTRMLGGSLELVKGKLVLEAGCGAGRFTEILLAAGARVFAADLSNAVEANYNNCHAYPHHFVCQADILKLPVPPALFDIVLCAGVIQHTPSPEATLSALCTYLKPGGLLVVDHYSYDYPLNVTRRALRSFLLKRSRTFGMRFCHAMTAVLWPLHRLAYVTKDMPVARSIGGRFLRYSPVVDYHYAHPQLGPRLLHEWAILDTHDTLTDHYKHLRGADQLDAHLRRCGMSDIVTIYVGNGVEARATKPADVSQIRR